MTKPKEPTPVDEPTPVGFGSFKKDDRTIVATSVEDAVRYRFDGWEEVGPALPENVDPAAGDES